MIVGVLIAIAVYLIAAVYVANWYFGRRHGVKGRVGFYQFGEKQDAGTKIASLVGAAWPISPFFPKVRNPELCRHSEHVLARARQS
ncbi:hypothetical protein [Antrihabitans spumae]|uniref:Uncharacterized protein n=1 Tax=Antrihabitans spumae TaxID=3373370 RepID=A0ABW7KL27_9NOCA